MLRNRKPFLIEFHFRFPHIFETRDRSNFHHWRARIGAQNRLFLPLYGVWPKMKSPYITGWKLNIFSELFSVNGIWRLRKNLLEWKIAFFSFVLPPYLALLSFLFGQLKASLWVEQSHHGQMPKKHSQNISLQAKLWDLHILLSLSHNSLAVLCFVPSFSAVIRDWYKWHSVMPVLRFPFTTIFSTFL